MNGIYKKDIPEFLEFNHNLELTKYIIVFIYIYIITLCWT